MARRVLHVLRTALAAVVAALRAVPGLVRRLPALLRRVPGTLRRVPGLLRRAPGALVTLGRTARHAARPLAHPLRVMRDGFRLRYDRPGIVAHLAIVLAFLALGLVLALPPNDVTHRCPAPGEGRDWCVLQKSYLPLFLIVFSALCLGQFVARTVLVRIPEWRDRRADVGERRVGEEETREDPPYTSDPFLLAATWGQKHGPSERRRPDVLGWLGQARASMAARVRRRRLPD